MPLTQGRIFWFTLRLTRIISECVSRSNINAELAKHAAAVQLVNAQGYFYFLGGEAADWLDRAARRKPRLCRRGLTALILNMYCYQRAV